MRVVCQWRLQWSTTNSDSPNSSKKQPRRLPKTSLLVKLSIRERTSRRHPKGKSRTRLTRKLELESPPGPLPGRHRCSATGGDVDRADSAMKAILPTVALFLLKKDGLSSCAKVFIFVVSQNTAAVIEDATSSATTAVQTNIIATCANR